MSLAHAPTRDLATFTATLDLDQVPTHVVEAARAALLDAVGCAMFGSTLPWSQTITAWVRDQGGTPEATLWPQQDEHRTTTANTAMALGSMIHAYDFDDYHTAKVHPGAVVIPAALALAESRGASGRELLTAIIAGYEAMIRVSLATGPSSSRTRGWHLTGTTGTFGAAAAASRLRGLDPETTASALGLGGTQSAGLWAFTADGAQSKRLHSGRSAYSGVLAADLAERGFVGPRLILEAEDGGFCRATSDDADLSQITDSLGEYFHAGDVTLKPYACCGSLHSSIDALRALMSEHALSAEGVERIICHTSPVVIQQCGFEYAPTSVLQAQMSGQYCLAVTLLDGHALTPQFAQERIGRADVLAVANKVEFAVDSEISELYPRQFAGRVEVIRTDGTRLDRRVGHPLGSPQHPMTPEDQRTKFHSLTDPVTGRGRAEAIAAAVATVEKHADINGLVELLR